MQFMQAAPKAVTTAQTAEERDKSRKLRGKSAEDAEMGDISPDAAAASSAETGSKSLRSMMLDVARCSTEAMRMAREAHAVLLLTFIVPIGSVSETITAGGQAYHNLVKSKSVPKQNNKPMPPCAYKWCALVCALNDVAKQFLEKVGCDPDEKEKVTEANETLTDHRKAITEISLLQCDRMHCVSRFNYDKDSCIISVASPFTYPAVVASMTVIFKIVLKVDPCMSTAPPTKAERRARTVISSLEKSSKA